MLTVVEFARQVLDMQYELEELRAENERLKKFEEKYNKLLNDSVKHNDAMMAHLLVATLNGNIVAKEPA